MARLEGMNLAAPEQSSTLFKKPENREIILSRWKCTIILASKVGKGLFKDNKAQLLIVKHWLEAIDPFHRYGENMKLYYEVWLNSHTPQPFLHWLDIGDGKQLDLKECSRAELQRQCVRYLGPKERQEYEVTIENGKLVYKQSGEFVHTSDGMKWIYVLSSSRCLFVGVKERGQFQHSSFLSGAATVAAGRLVVSNGMLQAIWAYSGHYRTTEENFTRLIRFLDEQQVDLTNVKLCPIDDDVPSNLVSRSDSTDNDPPVNTELSENSSATTELVGDHK